MSMASEVLHRARAMVSRVPKKPIVAVIGATGTGKSKLAVSLATKYNGEIVNADAVQMYKGLPIVTNKLPEHERNGIPHHLIDCIGLDEKAWTAHQFVKESSKIIEEIRQRGKLPIVVGGTNYYIHGLLFLDVMLSEIDDKYEYSERTEAEQVQENTRFPILHESTEVLMSKLREVDPVMASRWHPNDRRRIQRSLEIYLQTGQKASDFYLEQQQRRDDYLTSPDSFENMLRYDPLIFWLDAENATLKQRLNDRVDGMLESGLLEEVDEMQRFADQREKEGRSLKRSETGVWIAIGYKEMEPWLKARENVSESDQSLSQVQAACVEATKGGTRRYANRQKRFIRIRLSRALREARAKHLLFLLDCTDLANWESEVERQSQILLESFLRGHELPEPASISKMAAETFARFNGVPNSMLQSNTKFCGACQKTMATERDWLRHVNSRSHEKILARQKRASQHTDARDEDMGSEEETVTT